jgi:hypothetical protein
MTKRHILTTYLDGHIEIAYCKVCSAEGAKLFESCPQKVEKSLDDKKLNAKKSVIENEE